MCCLESQLVNGYCHGDFQWCHGSFQCFRRARRALDVGTCDAHVDHCARRWYSLDCRKKNFDIRHHFEAVTNVDGNNRLVFSFETEVQRFDDVVLPGEVENDHDVLLLERL